MNKSRMFLFSVLLMTSLLVLNLQRGFAGARGILALTPPMGWNSWDCHGPSVTEAEVKANAGLVQYRR